MGRKTGRRLERGIGHLLLALGVGFLVDHSAGRPGAVAASQPPSLTGYFVDSTQALARRPSKAGEAQGEFTYTVRRGFADSTSERMLGIAEAAYPPRDLLIEVASNRGHEVGPDSAGVPLWWCQGLGERRIPYAITVGALDHYLRLTRFFRDRQFREAGARPLFWSDLSYRATVAQRDTFLMGSKLFRNVYVAQLHLLWTYDDGTFMPTARAERVVVLSSGGDLLAVDGDGKAQEKVAMSTHRGIGRQEKVLR